MISSLYTLFLIISIIPLILLTLNYLFNEKKMLKYEKLTPFECGFDPQSLNRLPFNIQFFLTSMIFLIFDVEIAILIPLTFSMYIFSNLVITNSMFFIIILFLGLYIEYLEKSLEWKL